ncbi:hypothetical protein [Halomarina ordinaria]|uniref:Uncharacterized protein n=1 Tax=Halomarina ordinaria TaxID=3033939 RepID=A0ABD5UFW4_9EURY|nr:hypothetical protein [Halomarina sp. PSRA2]
MSGTRTTDVTTAEIIELNVAEEGLAGIVQDLQARGVVTDDDAADLSTRVQSLTDELRGCVVGTSLD